MFLSARFRTLPENNLLSSNNNIRIMQQGTSATSLDPASVLYSLIHSKILFVKHRKNSLSPKIRKSYQAKNRSHRNLSQHAGQLRYPRRAISRERSLRMILLPTTLATPPIEKAYQR